MHQALHLSARHTALTGCGMYSLVFGSALISLLVLSDRFRLPEKSTLSLGLAGLSPTLLAAARGLRYSTIPGDGGVFVMVGVGSRWSCRVEGARERLRLLSIRSALLAWYY